MSKKIFELSSLEKNLDLGFVIKESRGNSWSLDEALGFAVSSAGDMNGDGFGDVIISAPGIGRAYVVFGNSSEGTLYPRELNGTNGFVVIDPNHHSFPFRVQYNRLGCFVYKTAKPHVPLSDWVVFFNDSFTSRVCVK